MSHDEHIHLRPQEALERFFRTAYYGLVFVEGSFQHQGHAGNFFKRFDQRVITRVGIDG